MQSHTNSRLQTAHAPAPAARAPAPAAFNRKLPGPTWRALARHSLHEIERKLEVRYTHAVASGPDLYRRRSA